MAKERRKKWRDALTLGVLPLDLADEKSGENLTDQISFLAFEVGGQGFAIGVEHTEGVVDCPRVTPLPGPPDGVIGVTSVRGKMTIVMDLSLGANPKDEKRRLVLLKGDAQLGLLADNIDGVVVIKPDEVGSAQPRKASAGSAKSATKSWLTDKSIKSRGRVVTVIDGERLAGA
ncbi:MAG TPA: chemotaxis protein CheW [Blastocatellia bacterium]|nr:chemotaxis protein CheW [Blastocatellia bacterium]